MPTLTPLELTRLLHPRPKARPPGPVRPEDRPNLSRAAPDPHSPEPFDAWAAWEAPVDAGRIGVPAPPPAPGGGDRLASLEAILSGPGRRA